MESDINKNEVAIPLNGFSLNAYLHIPEDSIGLVIFSYGSGSSRFSPRDNYVARLLNKNHIATLLPHLLTVKEDQVFKNRFNIPLLTERLQKITEFALKHPQLKNLPVGYFGASTGAASALNASAHFLNTIKAIVSRGGRPDLAREHELPFIKSPTLLIVGSLDIPVISFNDEAFYKLTCKKEMVVVKGASHLFEEPGKLEEVAVLASGWFKKYLIQSSTLSAKNKEKTIF